MRSIILMVLIACAALGSGAAAAARPNVVVILTDDQGYGDIAAHGNTMIRTPHLDRLHAESVRLTNFHVDPTCAPTRAALLTGRYSTRTGVWHTIMGRSLMSGDELTLAEVFAANGYRTGQFGKWHLGDNAPLRPMDQGFEDCVYHGGGGVTQTPDAWGNDYFDDVYLRNGKPERFSGYCTDVWFSEASRFIAAHHEEPFFCYVAANAPHSPYLVADEYKQPYLDAGVAEPMASFYGMIANIDENVGRLRQQLDELRLSDNTILIFMTDNGTAAGVAKNPTAGGWTGFNAGMRGQKGSEYEGGHRVPCFIHWPQGELTGGRDADQLVAHIDVLPTLVELCRLKKPNGPPLDGHSLAAVLRGGEAAVRDRTLLVHSQRVEHPEKWRKSAVMTERWRLINGEELYDLAADPGQQRDVSATHTDVVQSLRASYEEWWTSLTPVFDDYVRIAIGSNAENPSRLTCHDWHTDAVPWNQATVARDPAANGAWAIEVARAGRYTFTLRLRPEGVEHRLAAGVARVRVGDVEASAPIEAGAPAATLTLNLKAGPAMLQTWLDERQGTSRGAFFVEARRVE